MIRKLTDLDPTWVSAYGGRERVGVAFNCPCGAGDACSIGGRCFIPFENPEDGQGPHASGPHWKRTGTTFEELTLHPSINGLETDGRSHWHGWLRNGELIPC